MTPAIPLWIGLIVAVFYLPMTENAPSWPRSGVKTVPLAAFTVAAWMSGAPTTLTLAFALSALGDFALSRRGEHAFAVGLAAFALAHTAYIFLFLDISGASLWAGLTRQPVLALFLIAITGSTEYWLTPHVGPLKWPVRIYAVVITLMGLAALTLPLGAITVGAAYFIASDTLLAYQLFRMSDDNPLIGRTGWAIWILYVAGQAMIFTGATG